MTVLFAACGSHAIRYTKKLSTKKVVSMAVGDRLRGFERQGLIARIVGLMESKRTFAAILAVGVKLAAPLLGLPAEVADLLATAVLAWLAGDTIRATGAIADLVNSTRFWLTLTSAGTTILVPLLGIPVALVSPIIVAISIVVLGKSWREMEPKN